MRENRPFTDKEDQILKNLYEEQNIKKWSIIARTLTQTYNLPRNAKQCRDRYQQHLDPMMVSEWTPEQQQKLYWLHDEIGNKWAVIAQKFPGRYMKKLFSTDNSVKNHFYAKLRKSLRHLNKFIKNHLKKQFKQLKIGAIYKIIQALEDRFNENTIIQQQVFNRCIRLKKELLEYSNTEIGQMAGQFEKQKQLIKEIIEFSKTYKRKTKKQRRNSLNGAELFKLTSVQKRIKYSSDHQSSQSQYSLALSHKEPSQNDSEQSQIKLGIIQEDIRESMTSRYEPGLRLTQKQQQQALKNELKLSYKSNNVQQALKGITEQGQIYYSRHDRSLWSSQKSQSERADMFDDSIRISQGLRNIQQMDEESPEENIFRSHQ